MICAASLLSLAAGAVAAGLHVRTDFDGGSATVLSIDEAAGRIEIAPAVHEERGWPCWWYMRIEGAETGRPLDVHVRASTAEFRAGQVLKGRWALPAQAFVSRDNTEWIQTAKGVEGSNSATYRVAAPAEVFWMAWGPPFLPSHADMAIAAAARQVPGAERFELARTRGGRPVAGVRLGMPGAPAAVWVQARQHAWEVGGSWCAAGFIEWAAGDAPEAAALRRTSEIFVVPIMDVDNVVLGAGGKEAVPRDHNRDWDEQPVYPEVAAAQQRIASLAAARRLRVYLDLHDPGPREAVSYFYGPLEYEQMVGPRRERYDRFLQLAVETMDGPLRIAPNYRFATYVKTEEERRRVSGAWVRRQAGDEAVALSLEVVWDTPNSTAENYRDLGRRLARTVARHVAGSP